MNYFTDQIIEQAFTNSNVAIFDLNGLIVDDEPIQHIATNFALSKYGAHITEEQWIATCVGHKPSEYLPTFLSEYADELTIAAIIKDKDNEYMRLAFKHRRKLLRTGVLDFLNHLRFFTKIRIALATSTTRFGMNSLLGTECLDIESYFEYKVCGDDVKKAKPHPEIYLSIVKIFPEKTNFIALEDSQPGLLSAKNAGISCIAIPNKFTLNTDLKIANLCISDLSRSAKIITKKP